MSVAVGDVYVVERRLAHGSSVQHTWRSTVTRVTPTRAYFVDGTWFALDDSDREVRPRYSSYRTTATPKSEDR